MTKAIGILGGTFDPVHHGHLRMALEVYQQLGLQEVRLIPLYIPPHRRSTIANPGQRLTMLEIAVKNKKMFIIDDCEITREGTSYTIDTVKALRRQYNDQSICLIMGMDAFQSINTWRQWDHLLDYVHFVIVDRPGSEVKLKQKEVANLYSTHVTRDNRLINDRPSGSILKLDLPVLDIASTRIRDLIAANRSIDYLVPEPVVTYIENESLYQ